MTVQDALLLCLMLIVVWQLYRLHRDPANNFNLFDLVMENGRVSRIGFAFMVALAVTSIVLLVVARIGKQSIDGIFTSYCLAWVAPIVAKLFSPPPPMGTTTASTSSTTTRTEADHHY